MPSIGDDLKKKRRRQQEEEEAREKNKLASNKVFRRRKYDQDGTTSIWLVSFTDVMALMLTFFVLLFSMSHPKKEDWEDFSQNVKKQFSKFYGMAMNPGIQDGTININKVNFEEARELLLIQQLLQEHINTIETLRGIVIIPQPPNAEKPTRLIVSMPDNLLFESGSASLKAQGSEALFDLQVFLDRIPNRIEIIGNADPRPIPAGGQFPSNWELSLTRAAAVAAALENYGYSRDLTMRGQSSGRYKELPNSLTTSEKLALSRRVDIVIFPDTGERLNIIEFE